MMSRDITEIIDDDCREQLGHSNWVIISTLSDQEKVGIETQGIFKTYEGVDVLFYFDKSNVCDFCSWDEGLFTEHDGELYCDECFEKLTNLGEGNG